MSDQRFVFAYTQDLQTVVRALRTKWDTGLPKVKGQGWASAIKILQCLLMAFGALGVGIALEYLVSGQLRLTIWSVAIGIVLLYVSIFGVFVVTMPVMARRALATRSNRGTVHMTLDGRGITTKMDHFESHIQWQGVEAVTRTKHAFVFWVGGNRPSLPFHAVKDAAQIDAVDDAIKSWMEASR